MEHSGSTMLHLDDESGDHSVFLSLDLIARIEFPLLAFKKGMEEQEAEYAAADAEALVAEPERIKSSRPTKSRKKKT
jgi:hypothetical protein